MRCFGHKGLELNGCNGGIKTLNFFQAATIQRRHGNKVVRVKDDDGIL